MPVELQIGYGTRSVATQRIFSQGTVISTRASVPVRIKDMARLQLGEEIQLTGMGLIIGQEDTGDGRQASFTLRMLANMMKRMQLAVDPTQIRVRNVAAVSTTATLSPYHRKGSRIDVQVASLGDAETLQRARCCARHFSTRWPGVCAGAGPGECWWLQPGWW